MNDRDDEIADLRARLARLEGSTPLPHAKTRPPRAWQFVVGVSAVALVGALLLFGRDIPPPSNAGSFEASSSQCSETVSNIRVGSAVQSGSVMATEMMDGGLVVVLSGEGARMSASDLAELAGAYDCGVAGRGRHLTKIMFRRSLNGATVSEFRAADLMRLREDLAGS